MNKKELASPNKEEIQTAFKISKEMYQNQKSHYEIVSKEKPELAHLFTMHPKMVSLCGYGYGEEVGLNGVFNINTYRQYGSYPFIQIISPSITIASEPYAGPNIMFNGYIQGGLDMPEVHFENLLLAGVLQNIQTIINIPLNLQLFINPENIILRFYEGNIYLGDMTSILQHNFQAPIPIEFSGTGSFTYE
ncbi:hypothetical protein [Xenorhabdus hominickii]|uniref:Uncharacterized protein n=1 Tax=Xenorhabdus hominickii TaxID=351679 RepID=A0A2G0QAL5_XENHO|nr:hypothetical protein [Xenorhabdus hominickii]AOM40793.1 hypothetical protein A9255_09425 [Xenorhabdus hominickii]PHM56256.1 hypothetical protein Xhom_01741 [Xenorhabdus hominickii]